MANKVRIKLPKSAAVGEIIFIKATTKHPMVTGFGKNEDGSPQERDIARELVVTFNGSEILRQTIDTGISTNPFVNFPFKVPGPGAVEFTYKGDNGFEAYGKKDLKVEG